MAIHSPKALEILYGELCSGSDKIVNNLHGQLLTVVDAVISDPTQRKAVKDLLKGKILFSQESPYVALQGLYRHLLSSLVLQLLRNERGEDVGTMKIDEEPLPYWFKQWYKEPQDIQSLEIFKSITKLEDIV